ncbi:MAG: hypothetical protein PHF63_12015, partial [Herbinix sp.]|nr:hypothetical protein [Herbinix sp.]
YWMTFYQTKRGYSMRQLLLYFFIIFGINVPGIDLTIDTSGFNLPDYIYHKNEQYITPMEALDLVKEHYADNFDKIYEKNSTDKYIYKLTFADYYLVYEGEVGTEKDYLIHLYEFVVDEPETGIGHTVTYGWYTVDKESGEITEQIN